MCFIWNEQVFIRFLFFLTQEGLHITGSKRLAFFLEQGIVRVRANSPTQGKIRFFLRCFLRYIEIIPEYTRSTLNFFPFFCVKLGKKREVLNGIRIQITFF